VVLFFPRWVVTVPVPDQILRSPAKARQHYLLPTFFCGALVVIANSPQNAAKHRKTPQNATNIANWQ